MSSEPSAVEAKDIDTSPTELPPSTTPPTSEQHLALVERFSQVSEEKVNLQAEKERLLTEVEKLKREVNTNAILDSLIRPMANKIFCFMCCYCVGVGLFVAYAIYRGLTSDRLLLLMVGSTAVTVIGLVGTIVAGIFGGARRGANS